MRRLLPAAVLLLAAASCNESQGPTPGPLDLRLSFGAASAPRALLLVVRGPKDDVTWSAPAGTSFRVVAVEGQGDTTRLIIVAPQGQTLAAGAVARMQVPDVRQASQYRATTAQAASSTYAVLPGSSYSVTVVRP